MGKVEDGTFCIKMFTSTPVAMAQFFLIAFPDNPKQITHGNENTACVTLL